jgi:hypothetical protein
VSLLKVPYAKSPFDLHIRIARDFEVETKEKDKKKDKGKEDKKKNKEKNEEEEKEDGSSSGSGSNKASQDAAKALTSKSEDAGAERSLEKPTKKDDSKTKPAKEKHSDGRHKRMWNVVITCDEWKSIYGVKNVSVSKAKRVYDVLVAKCCS